MSRLRESTVFPELTRHGQPTRAPEKEHFAIRRRRFEEKAVIILANFRKVLHTGGFRARYTPHRRCDNSFHGIS
jgi:hypothetical protein